MKVSFSLLIIWLASCTADFHGVHQGHCSGRSIDETPSISPTNQNLKIIRVIHLQRADENRHAIHSNADQLIEVFPQQPQKPQQPQSIKIIDVFPRQPQKQPYQVFEEQKVNFPITKKQLANLKIRNLRVHEKVIDAHGNSEPGVIQNVQVVHKDGAGLNRDHIAADYTSYSHGTASNIVLDMSNTADYRSYTDGTAFKSALDMSNTAYHREHARSIGSGNELEVLKSLNLYGIWTMNSGWRR